MIYVEIDRTLFYENRIRNTRIEVYISILSTVVIVSNFVVVNIMHKIALKKWENSTKKFVKGEN